MYTEPRLLRLSLASFLALAGACGDDVAPDAVDAAGHADAGHADAGRADAGSTAEAGAVPDGASVAATCPNVSGKGTLVVSPTGLPADARVHLNVNSPIDGLSFSFTGPGSLPTPAGFYVVAPVLATAPGPLVRTAYRPLDRAILHVCVRAGETVTVPLAYARIPSSGRLWVGDTQAGGATLGFAPEALAASGAPEAAVAAKTASGAFTFDRAGNLWVLGATPAEPPLSRYPAERLGASGPIAADVTITSPSFGAGAPGPSALAFDWDGNLWVSVGARGKVVRFTPDQLATSGNPTAAVELGGIDGPSGIAFMGGHLFVAAKGAGKILRFQSGRLDASTSGADSEIAVQTPPPGSVTLQSPEGLAFDEGGDLWVSFGGAIVELGLVEIQSLGPVTLRPLVQIVPPAGAMPRGIAFDEGGGLWLGYLKGSFARFAPAQLKTSGAKTPETIVASAGSDRVGGFAMYPAPSGVNLPHGFR